MTQVSRASTASPERIFRVLADGWTLPTWMVGLAHARHVDPSWPEVGSRVTHRVGPWPMSRNGVTKVIACEPDHMLEVSTRYWPGRKPHLRVTLSTDGDARTLVLLRLDPTPRWPASRVARSACRESLDCLVDLAEARVTDAHAAS